MNHKYALLTIIWTILAHLTFQQPTMIAYQMKVSLKQLPLPISMSSILNKGTMSKIQIKMGHLTSNIPYLSFPRGITAYIYNITQISNDQLNHLANLFQISTDKRFQTYLPQQKIIIISDPNDRFCTEHIEYMLRYFFLCKNFGSLGLERLISPSKLLQKYLVLEFEWISINQELNFKIIFPKQRQVSSFFKKQTICGQISVYQITSSQNNGPLTDYYQNNVQYDGKMINRWYSRQKCISHTFQIRQIKNSSRIKLITLLPLGLILYNITSYPSNIHFNQTIKKIGSSLSIIIDLPLHNKQEKQITIQIYFRSSIPPFQTFQTIAGGGQEIMNIPLYFENDYMRQLHSSIITQRLLEPDFSIPFQTITFTVGIVGYLWISLWRIHKLKHDQLPKLTKQK